MRMFLLVVTLVVGGFVYWQAGNVVESANARNEALIKTLQEI